MSDMSDFKCDIVRFRVAGSLLGQAGDMKCDIGSADLGFVTFPVALGGLPAAIGAGLRPGRGKRLPVHRADTPGAVPEVAATRETASDLALPARFVTHEPAVLLQVG